MQKSQVVCMLLCHALVMLSCQNSTPSGKEELIKALDLKRGNLISCGAVNNFGKLEFDMSCSEEARADFNLGVELLHSFEYDEAEKVFAKVIDQYPDCAMAYWGVAMSNFHALWSPPTEAELIKGNKAIELGLACKGLTAREAAYIRAIQQYYSNWQNTPHIARCKRFESAMEKLSRENPGDKEAAIFYALSLDAAADPTDKAFVKQKKAASILNSLYPSEPEHPGIIHYLIHTYDYPGLAQLALPAARKYAEVAPSSAHALHMPSHIFTRLGLWDESIKANLHSVSAAKCYAEAAGIKGHWDEELHGMDYLIYAYLQQGDSSHAKELLDYLHTITEVSPANFKVAYSFASMPCRYLLETKDWKGAAEVKVYPEAFKWSKFPWQKAIFYYTRALGQIHNGNLTAAHENLAILKQLKDTLDSQKDQYKSMQVNIQAMTIEAWINLKAGNKEKGLDQMRLAANMEDSTSKHPVTPCEILPARELLGDMLVEMKEGNAALREYQTSLQKNPNRLNSLRGKALATKLTVRNNKETAYDKSLLSGKFKGQGIKQN